MQPFLDHASHNVVSGGGEHRSESALTADQVGRLASLLQDQLADLHQRLDHHDEVFSSIAEDASTDGIERHAARRAAEQDLELIRSTNRAITAIDVGTYGVCTVCARPIPFERLEALPATQTCVACPDSS